MSITRPFNFFKWIEDNKDNFKPPNQLDFLRSDGATTLTLNDVGANFIISFCICSPIPGKTELSPDNMIFEYKSLRISVSHLLIELLIVMDHIF